ncbi:MAG: hypothetical protein K8S54_01715 [Spirochaetia bacterium]|nr:hypothetical protein [Spirochaetia bacterium]
MFKANLLDILIVDTDKGLSDYLEKELRQRGLTVQTTDSPAVALAIVSEHIPRVILTDVEFAETPTNEYLDALDQWSPTSVVIVHTHQLFAEVPNHVFEALRKPGKMESVVEASLRALEFQRELVQTLELEELHKREFVNRLTWLLWKRRSEARATLEHGRQIISNLRHSVAQGEGVGGMVTQMEILLMSKPDASGNRILKPDFADMLRESVTSVRAWLGSLERFSATRRLRYEGELLDSEDIRTLIEESLAIVEKFRRVGDQEIVVDPIRFEGRVLSSRAALGLTLRELLTNAFKYSPPGSCVNMI